MIVHITHLYGKTKPGAFAYYYCSGTNTSTKSNRILGSFLRQLASTTDGLEILKKWTEKYDKHELTNQHIGSLLSEMIKLNSSGAQTTIIIDAPDEIDSSSFSEVVEVLETPINGGFGLVKVSLSSIQDYYIESALSSWARIGVNGELTAPDMQAYIDIEVHKKLLHVHIDDESVREVLEKDVNQFLKEQARGM